MSLTPMGSLRSDPPIETPIHRSMSDVSSTAGATSAVFERLREVVDADHIPGADEVALVGRHPREHLAGDLATVGPVAAVVRVVGRPRHVALADVVAIQHAHAIGDEGANEVVVEV